MREGAGHDKRLGFPEKLSDVLYQSTQVTRREIFGDADVRFRPVSEPDDAHVMFAGYIGKNYRPGRPLLLAINPGGGGDTYRRTPADKAFYPLLYEFKNSPPEDRFAAFEAINSQFPGVAKMWPIWRLIDHVLAATRRDVEEIAYLNAVPYRTKNDSNPLVEPRRNAWQKTAYPAIEAMQPGRILALGNEAGKVLDRFYSGTATCYTIPRTRGDKSISAEARVALERIRHDSTQR